MPVINPVKDKAKSGNENLEKATSSFDSLNSFLTNINKLLENPAVQKVVDRRTQQNQPQQPRQLPQQPQPQPQQNIDNNPTQQPKKEGKKRGNETEISEEEVGRALLKKATTEKGREELKEWVDKIIGYLGEDTTLKEIKNQLDDDEFKQTMTQLKSMI